MMIKIRLTYVAVIITAILLSLAFKALDIYISVQFFNLFLK